MVMNNSKMIVIVSALTFITNAHNHNSNVKCGVHFDKDQEEQTVSQGQCGPSVLKDGSSMSVQCISEMGALITLFQSEDCQPSSEDRSLIVTGQQEWIQDWMISAECKTSCLDSDYQTCGMVDTRSETDGELWQFQRDGLCLAGPDSSSQVFCRCDGNALVRKFDHPNCEGNPREVMFYNTSELASDAEFDVWCDPFEDCRSTEYSDLSAVDGALIKQDQGSYSVLAPHTCLDHSVMVDCTSPFQGIVSVFDHERKEDCAGMPHTEDFTSHGETVMVRETALQIHCWDDCVHLDWDYYPAQSTSNEPLMSTSSDGSWDEEWGELSSTGNTDDVFEYSSSIVSSSMSSSMDSDWGQKSSEQEADWDIMDVVDKHTSGAATHLASKGLAALSIGALFMFCF